MFDPDTALMWDAIQIVAVAGAVTSGAVCLLMKRLTEHFKKREAADRAATEATA